MDDGIAKKTSQKVDTTVKVIPSVLVFDTTNFPDHSNAVKDISHKLAPAILRSKIVGPAHTWTFHPLKLLSLIRRININTMFHKSIQTTPILFTQVDNDDVIVLDDDDPIPSNNGKNTIDLSLVPKHNTTHMVPNPSGVSKLNTNIDDITEIVDRDDPAISTKEMATQVNPSDFNEDLTKVSSTQTDFSQFLPPRERILPNWLSKSVNDGASTSRDSNKRPLDYNPTYNTKKIKIDSSDAFNLFFNEKAVLNLSNKSIPQEVLIALSLGPKFMPPFLDHDKHKIVSDVAKLKTQ